jgi:hypothetical protein
MPTKAERPSSNHAARNEPDGVGRIMPSTIAGTSVASSDDLSEAGRLPPFTTQWHQQ